MKEGVQNSPEQPSSVDASAPTQPASWNVLVKTYGGQISLFKGLTETEARGICQRTPISHSTQSGDPWSDWRIAEQVAQEVFGKQPWWSGGYCYSPSDNDVTEVQCWGPGDAHLNIWPKPADFQKRYAAALRKAKREKAAQDASPAVIATSPVPTVSTPQTYEESMRCTPLARTEVPRNWLQRLFDGALAPHTDSSATGSEP